MAFTSVNVRPASSSAAIVFSNVGAAPSPAMTASSRRFSAIACSNAGLKCSTLTRENGGTPPCGPDHFARSGFDAAAGGGAGGGEAEEDDDEADDATDGGAPAPPGAAHAAETKAAA